MLHFQNSWTGKCSGSNRKIKTLMQSPSVFDHWSSSLQEYAKSLQPKESCLTSMHNLWDWFSTRSISGAEDFCDILAEMTVSGNEAWRIQNSRYQYHTGVITMNWPRNSLEITRKKDKYLTRCINASQINFKTKCVRIITNALKNPPNLKNYTDCRIIKPSR